MNNGKVVEDFSQNAEKIEQQRIKASNEEKASYAASVLETIRALQAFGPFKNFVKLLVDPEIKKMRSILDESRDLIELYRAQGSTKSIKKIFDLSAKEKEFAADLQKYKQRSEKGTKN